MELMKSPYRRATRAVALADVPEPLLDGLRAHAERQHLDLADVRCWLTRSENPPGTGVLARLLRRRANPVDPDPVHDQVLVLHATHVLVGTHGEHRGTAVLSAPCLDVAVERGYGLRSDHGAEDGVTITGIVGSSGPHTGPGSLFVGLGPSPDGRAAEEALIAAVAASKRG